LLFIEEISELILAELRRAQRQIHARELRHFGPLSRVEEKVGAVGRPRDGVRVPVGEKARRLHLAAGGGHQRDVREAARARGEERDPSAVWRPRERMADLQRIRDQSLRERAVTLAINPRHVQLRAAAHERDRFAVG